MLQKLSIFNRGKAFMEEEYEFQAQQLVFGGGGNAHSAVDEAYINGVCDGLSYRSLLTYGSYDPTTVETPDLVKMPKTEPLFALNDGGSGEAPPYIFFSDAASSSVDLPLPDLLSLEPPHNSSTAVAGGSQIPNPAVPCRRQRRRRPAKRLSDKTRCLQKLLPLDARMDMATVLEEAYKYIKFLQAQISVLQSMPCDGAASPASYGFGGGGDLGRLNRQQLLQVVVNSPVAQTQLYSQGCCLYSVEQLALLKQNAERKALYHQMMLGCPNPNSFPA